MFICYGKPPSDGSISTVIHASSATLRRKSIRTTPHYSEPDIEIMGVENKGPLPYAENCLLAVGLGWIVFLAAP